jgi:hypothetical protein
MAISCVSIVSIAVTKPNDRHPVDRNTSGPIMLLETVSVSGPQTFGDPISSR